MNSVDKTREHFKRFLYNKNAYIEFCTALRERHDCSFKERFEQRIDISEIIDNSITWGHTPRGRDFWKQVHVEWRSECRRPILANGCKSIW